MQPSENLKIILDAFESCRLVAYWDGTYLDEAKTQQRWSIGWGTTRYFDSGQLVQEHDNCTQARADALRDADMAAFAKAVDENLAPVIATWDAQPAAYQNMYDALVDFAYNDGDNNLKGSTLLRLLLAGDVTGAAQQFTRWTLDNGKRSNGLLRRRLAEQALFLGQFKPDGSLRLLVSDFPGVQWYPSN